MGITADQAPLAQRWNDVPPMQFHAPSFEQVPVRLPAVEVEELPPAEAAEGAALATGDAAEGAAAAGDDAAEGAAAAGTAAVPVAAEAGAALLAKTPGATVGDDAAALEPLFDELPLEELEPVEAEAPVQPVGGPKVEPATVCTDEPGSGNLTSLPSVVPQPLETPWMFATNIAGKLVPRLETGAGAGLGS